MKDIIGTLLAIVLILYSLVMLLSVEVRPDNTRASLASNEESISDIGLRLAFKR